MKAAPVSADVKVADEVWIVTALLHQEHPEKIDFSIDEIMERAQAEKIAAKLRPGVYQHIVQHCVANRPPNSGRYRMLFETAPGRRRLFRDGDIYDSARENAKIIPVLEDLPPQYSGLSDWYRNWNLDRVEERVKNDPLLGLVGDGKELWADEHADEYVRRIREGWE